MKDWKIEDLKQGDEFKSKNGRKYIYQGHIGDFMAFIDERGVSMHYGIEEVKNRLILTPRPGWKDLTIEEACVLIKNSKKVWFSDDFVEGIGKGTMSGYSSIRDAKYEVKGVTWLKASMYDDNGRPADDYEGLGL